jgi:3-phosphoshikimate 1-carboxyvinyltransferase
MNLHILPCKTLHGTVHIPGSKSQSIRALLIASMAKGASTIHHLPESDDVKTAVELCKDLGVQISAATCHENCIRMESRGVPFLPIKEELWSGDSGITTCFALPLLALCTRPVRLNTGEQMKKRPLEGLLQNLRELGCSVQGPYKGGSTQVSGSTSQFISALLLSGIYAETDLKLTVENLNERPYVELTLDWLKRQNIRFEHVREGGTDHFHLFAGQHYAPIDYFVPGDYSSAATFLAAGALFDGDVKLEGLDPNDLQGDRHLLAILQEMGATVEWIDGAVQVKKSQVHGIDIDANAVPDLVPTLAVLGTQAEGITRILNVPHARSKETDRLISITEGLRAMGATIEELPDGLIIHPSKLHGASVHGYSDHRTIMALALAGLLAEGETLIDTAEGLSKTYPLFEEHLSSLYRS